MNCSIHKETDSRDSSLVYTVLISGSHTVGIVSQQMLHALCMDYTRLGLCALKYTLLQPQLDALMTERTRPQISDKQRSHQTASLPLTREKKKKKKSTSRATVLVGHMIY